MDIAQELRYATVASQTARQRYGVVEEEYTYTLQYTTTYQRVILQIVYLVASVPTCTTCTTRLAGSWKRAESVTVEFHQI
jgi:hypothetical protein